MLGMLRRSGFRLLVFALALLLAGCALQPLPPPQPTVQPQPTRTFGPPCVLLQSSEDAQARIGFRLLVPDPLSLPEGTVLESVRVCVGVGHVDSEGQSVALRYRSSTGYLDLVESIRPAGMGPFVDDVPKPTQTITVRGHQGLLVGYPPGLLALGWMEDDIGIVLSGNLPLETLLRIAEGLQPLREP